MGRSRVRWTFEGAEIGVAWKRNDIKQRVGSRTALVKEDARRGHVYQIPT